MKHIILALAVTMLSACGTVGGAMSGAGQDLGRAGEWIRTR